MNTLKLKANLFSLPRLLLNNANPDYDMVKTGCNRGNGDQQTLRFLRCLLFKYGIVPAMTGLSRSIFAFRSSRSRKNAFTLLELLVVITIIAILLGLLYGTIHTVSRYSRETITRGELANIEAAWKQYYSYYHTWPTNDVEKVGNSISAAGFQRYKSDGDLQYELGPYLANMLAGVTSDTTTAGLNQDGVVFMEFTRFDKETPPAPISAWGWSRGQRYYVKLDVNGDNTLLVPADAPGSNPTNTIFRRVAVWTVNPDLPGHLIVNWK